MKRTGNSIIDLKPIWTLAFLFLASSATAETVDYSSFFGGADGDNSFDICTDIQGNIIISGRTYASGFPLLNPADDSFGGTFDAVVAKFDPNGQPMFSTYLGGSGEDFGFAIASDYLGNVFVCGTTGSLDFPISPDAIDNQFGTEGSEGFIVKYSPTGQVLYISYFGGNGVDGISDVATDAEGYVYVLGSAAGGLPVTYGAFQQV